MVMNRSLFTILVTILLLAGNVAGVSPTESITWIDVVEESWQDSGTLGGISISLSNNTTEESASLDGVDWPTIIEVYTATWCLNCLQTEAVMENIVDGENTLQAHFHRFIAETQDPFGAESTDNYWLDRYAQTSLDAAGGERLAPTNIFDGERFHIGTSPTSDSIENDYSISFNTGSTIDKSGFSGSLAFSSEEGEEIFIWNISVPDMYSDLEIQPMIYFIEDVGYFPEGGNGADYYHHILRDVVKLPAISGQIPVEHIAAFDGDDLSAVLVFNWFSPEVKEDNSFAAALPAPALSILLPLFGAALLPRRDD
jgi:hypothetical protein